MLLISSPRFEEHVTPPGHPERMERAHVFDIVATDFERNGGTVLEPVAATREQLLRIHDEGYLDLIASTEGKPSMLDADTFTSPESYEIALLAAGAAVQAAQHAASTGEAAAALVRPPGHHAERDKAMGFCLYNNVAVAAAQALADGLGRVAIVDIDVHHGNGTQWSFYADPRVLYISSHQYPFYPGTGAAEQVGHAAGHGFTVNIPLEAGATDADYELVYRTIAAPVLAQFSPELMLISAGFDAHEADPLASMRMTASGYGRVLRLLKEAAGSGSLAVVTEGGYDLPALRECLEAMIRVIGGEPDAGAGEEPSATAPRGERAVASVRAAQAAFWRGI